jgi:pimeloyl-ACP methyl ester carboxylesterase
MIPFLVAIMAGAGLGSTSPAAPAPDRFEVYATPQRLVTLPGGRRMNLYCSGAGSPTVVLEGGWSDSDVAWRMVQPLVAKRTRVCSYDRAGLGFSDAAPGPRDTVHIVDDLEALLHAGGLKPPYVLVGYSMGSFSVRLFADRHLPDVAGMVLVEPSTERQTERFAAALPGRVRRIRPMTDAEECPPAQAVCKTSGESALPSSVIAARALQTAAPTYQQTILAELVGMNGDGAAQVAAARRSYGPLPLVVLTGADNVGDPAYGPAEIADFKTVWNAMHDDLAKLSSRGIRRSVANATHLMVFEQPKIIADAITEIIVATR